jgi:type IV pilus assembly protein PilO
MSSKMKQWVALTVVGCLAVLAAGWFLLVSPKRGDAAAIRDDVATQSSTNSALQTQLAMLKAQAKTLPQQQAALARVAAKIPDNPALPALIRALSQAAEDAGVELVSIAPGTPAAVATAPTAASTGAAGSTPVAGSGAAVGAQAAGVTKPAGTAGAPVTLGSASAAASSFSPGVLTSIPLTINVVGGYFQVEQFFDRVESLARAAKVTGFTMAPGSNPMKPPAAGAAAAPVETGKVLTTNVTANVYMAPGRGTVPTAVAPVK